MRPRSTSWRVVQRERSGPGGPDLRRAPQGLEWVDRSVPGADRALRGVGGRDGGGQVRDEAGLPVAVRSGGHSYPGHSVCDGGIVIDLGPMKGIRVDPEARTARAQAGVLWGELDRETQAFGLATTGGIVTHTGVAGLTLGGGIGWLHRRHGLTIDQLLSVDLITAEGEFVKASADREPRPLLGPARRRRQLRDRHRVRVPPSPVGPIVLAGPIFWPMEESPELLRFYRDWIADAPDELMTIVVQRRAPPLPFVPPELHGELVVGVVCCYAGTGRGRARASCGR